MKRTRTSNSRFPGRGRTTRNRRRLHLPSIRNEVKYFDTSSDNPHTSGTWASSVVICDEIIDITGQPAVYTGSPLNPGRINAGFGGVDSNGYSILKFHVRGRLHHPALTDHDADLVYKLCLVLDTQPNGVQASGELVMNSLTTGIEFAFKSMSDQPGRFTILKTQSGNISPEASLHSFTNAGFVNTSGTGTMAPYTQTSITHYKDEWFDFEWVPRTPHPVVINALTPESHGIGPQVNTNLFMILFTHGSTFTVHFASRCYYRNN